MGNLITLWRGELSLGKAFWTCAVSIGLLINITTTLLFLALITLDRPWMALLLGHAVSVPYNIAALVGVWRSAARYPGPSIHADLARVASLLLMVVLSLT